MGLSPGLMGGGIGVRDHQHIKVSDNYNVFG